MLGFQIFVDIHIDGVCRAKSTLSTSSDEVLATKMVEFENGSWMGVLLEDCL